MIADSIHDLKLAGNWTIADYRNTMTGNGTYQLHLIRQSTPSDPNILQNTPALVDYVSSSSNVIGMYVFDALFQDDRSTGLANLVHEQAHVWDNATGNMMSRDLVKATNGYYEWFGFGTYVPGSGASSTYLNDAREDWAETVAAAVYPKHERFYDEYLKQPQMGASRRSFIQYFLPDASIFD